MELRLLHLGFCPAGGGGVFNSLGWIRYAFDLDIWILAFGPAGRGRGGGCNAQLRAEGYLLSNVRNPRRRLSALEGVWPPLPNKIPTSSEKQEKRIVFTLLNELNSALASICPPHWSEEL